MAGEGGAGYANLHHTDVGNDAAGMAQGLQRGGYGVRGKTDGVGNVGVALGADDAAQDVLLRGGEAVQGRASGQAVGNH